MPYHLRNFCIFLPLRTIFILYAIAGAAKKAEKSFDFFINPKINSFFCIFEKKKKIPTLKDAKVEKNRRESKNLNFRKFF